METKDDVSASQGVENIPSQQDPLVGLQSQFGRGMDRLPIVRQAERLHTQVGPQFK